MTSVVYEVSNFSETDTAELDARCRSSSYAGAVLNQQLEGHLSVECCRCSHDGDDRDCPFRRYLETRFAKGSMVALTLC